MQQNNFPTLGPKPTVTSRPGSAQATSRNSENGWGVASVPYASTSRAAPKEKFPALGGPPGSAGAVALKAVTTKSKSSSKATPWSASNSSTTTTREAAARSNSVPSTSRTGYIENPPPPIASPSLAANRRPQTGPEYPSLPSSSTEIDRRARVKAALRNGGPSTITDRDDDEFETYNEASWGGAVSGASTRAGSPDYSSGGTNFSGNNGQMSKKKKAKPILLMSHSVHRG